MSVTANGLSIGISGIRAADEKLRASAHNVANLLTEDFHPERVVQQERAEGGVSVEVERSAEPQEVDLAQEIVDQQLASLQARASMQTIETQLEVLGSLIDIKA